MLCLAGKNLTQVDKQAGSNSGQVKHLDVSSNQLQSGISFRPFTNLITLVIDENQFRSLSDFPVFRDLQTFSANKNNFRDVSEFVGQAYEKFGKLKNLSTLKNPMNPYFEGQQKYNTFRRSILIKFGNLKTIDGSPLDGTNKSLMQTNKYDEKKYEKIIGVITFDQKYAEDAVKSVKTRSQGNRFLKNHHL